MKHKTTLTLALLGEITTDVKEMKDRMERIDDRLSDRERREICDWIEHTNPVTIHHQACKTHEEHTCQWIRRVDQWKDWLSLERRLIWIHGIPGAGKTILASYLIEQTIRHCNDQKSDRDACLYYYCSFTHGQGEQRSEALSFMRWIVGQLCRRSSHIPLGIENLHRQNTTLSLATLREALQSLLARVNVLYIIIDAVDESNPRKDLLDLIHDLVTQPNYGNIQLLVTSRRYGDIEGVLRPLSEPTLPMSNSIVDEDIRAYVEASMRRTRHFMRWPEQFLRETIDTLAQGAQGM